MRRIIALLVVAGALLLSPSVNAQQCGNVDGRSIIDIADMSYLASYLMMGDPPLSPSMDIDGWAGVSLGDFIELTEYLFVYFKADSFDCTPDFTYSFAPSPNDTVFVPRMLSIPTGVDSVLLPVRFSLQPGAGGVIVYLRQTPATNGFTANEVRETGVAGDGINGFGGFSEMGPSGPGNPVLCMWRDANGDRLAGTHQYFQIVYRGPGNGGAIELESYELETFRRTAVERNGDLVVPTVVYYDYQLPPDTLKVSPASLSFTSLAGRAINDTLSLTFTSTGSDATFDLAASQPWLKPAGPSSGLTTPVTVKVTVDASLVAMGNHQAELAVANAASPLGVIVAHPTVPVALTVGPPVIYPPGDVNCDGILDISDLSLIVARLTGYHGPITPCY